MGCVIFLGIWGAALAILNQRYIEGVLCMIAVIVVSIWSEIHE